MRSYSDAPEEQHWKHVGEDRRIPPYAMHRKGNRKDVEVVASIPDDGNYPKRRVLVRDGGHEVWVRVADQDEYGYPLQPEERVSEAELEAITLKHTALQEGSNVAVPETQVLIDAGEPEQMHHALIALYYAAKADPTIPGSNVGRLREIVHEQTGHIDTSHDPSLRRVLTDIDSLAE